VSTFYSQKLFSYNSEAPRIYFCVFSPNYFTKKTFFNYIGEAAKNALNNLIVTILHFSQKY
jgi:hypothetical protein